MEIQAAIGYVRVSTRKQGDSGLSIDAQRKVISAFCERMHFVLADVFVEIETGTAKKHRPILDDAIRTAHQHDAILIVAKLDRLTRSVSFLSKILDSNCEFLAVDMPSANRMLLQICAAIAEYEAGNISARIKAVSAERRARGEKLGAPENFSDEGRKKGARKNSAAAKTRNQKTAAYAAVLREQGLSLRKIAQRLTEAGYPAYSAMTVRRIIDNGAK